MAKKTVDHGVVEKTHGKTTKSFLEQSITGFVRLPETLIKAKDPCIMMMGNDAMIGAGISKGDLIVYKKQNYAEEGQLVLALVGETPVLRRYHAVGDGRHFCLHAENSAYADITPEKCIILGVATNAIKYFE